VIVLLESHRAHLARIAELERQLESARGLAVDRDQRLARLHADISHLRELLLSTLSAGEFTGYIDGTDIQTACDLALELCEIASAEENA
jgi:hypothetical protein